MLNAGPEGTAGSCRSASDGRCSASRRGGAERRLVRAPQDSVLPGEGAWAWSSVCGHILQVRPPATAEETVGGLPRERWVCDVGACVQRPAQETVRLVTGHGGRPWSSAARTATSLGPARDERGRQVRHSEMADVGRARKTSRAGRRDSSEARARPPHPPDTHHHGANPKPGAVATPSRGPAGASSGLRQQHMAVGRGSLANPRHHGDRGGQPVTQDTSWGQGGQDDANHPDR